MTVVLAIAFSSNSEFSSLQHNTLCTCHHDVHKRMRSAFVVFLLNPGLGYTDYWGEARVPAYRRRVYDTLHQRFGSVEFPFHWLDPDLCWHGGFAWWERKLCRVIRAIANEHFGGKYLDAMRDLSTRLASIELMPYHSASFRSHALAEWLPSSIAARAFVNSVLVPSARRNERLVIVTRGWRLWGKPMGTNVIVYRRGETRGAGLGPTTQGGRAILRHYRRHL